MHTGSQRAWPKSKPKLKNKYRAGFSNVSRACGYFDMLRRDLRSAHEFRRVEDTHATSRSLYDAATRGSSVRAARYLINVMGLLLKCIALLAAAQITRAAHHAYEALACASNAPWCVISDAKRGQVLVLDLESRALAAVWGRGTASQGSVWAAGLNEPRSLAVVERDSIILVGCRGGLRALATSTLDVSALQCGWQLEWGAPLSLAVDARGSSVRGRKAGTLVVYTLWEDGRARSCDVDKSNRVVDARAAVAFAEADKQRARTLAFDAGRGELYVGTHGKLLLAAPRILGSAVPVAATAVDAPGQLFFDAIAWRGPDHGAALDGSDDAEVHAASGALAAYDAGRGALWARSDPDGAFVEIMSGPFKRGAAASLVSRDDGDCSLVVLDGSSVHCVSTGREVSTVVDLPSGDVPRCDRAACLPWPATFPPRPTDAPVTYAPSPQPSAWPTYAPSSEPTAVTTAPFAAPATAPWWGLAYRAAPPVLLGGLLGLIVYLVVRRCRGSRKPVGKGGYARAKGDDSLDDEDLSDADFENVVRSTELRAFV